MGEVHHNLEFDDFEERSNYNNSPCDRLYIRIPGEHEIDGIRPDMELQLQCKGNLPFDKFTERISYISIPIMVDDVKGDDEFFIKTFGNEISLGQTYIFDGLDVVLNKFISVYGVFYYSGTNNFPECNPDHQWIVLNKQEIFISRKTMENFKDLIDKEKSPNGNSRKASDPSGEIKLLNFGNLKFNWK